jgi:hypothetical protein
MKLLVAIVLAASALITGCAVGGVKPGGSAPSTASAPGFSVETLTPIVDSAAYTGTRAVLLSHPEKRPVFVQAADALTALVAADTVTLVSLKTAIDPILSSDIRELRDPQTALIVDGAVTVADAVLGRYQLDEAKQAEVMAVAKAARNGIARALVVVPEK